MVTVRGRCAARDGRIHTDSKTKLITVLLYFNDPWEARGGRLRLLRSPTDLNDMIGEVPPEAGTMIAFRRSDRSYHGHEPYEGVRRYVMINWMTSDFAARRELLRHRLSARVKQAASWLEAGPQTGGGAMVDADRVAASLIASFDSGYFGARPYRHWLPETMLPDEVCLALDALPVAPPRIDDTRGKRETHNSSRLFFGVEARETFPVCEALASALQRNAVVARLERLCDLDLRQTHLRIEYCLDTEGFWLEPHTDIGAKMFTHADLSLRRSRQRGLGHRHSRRRSQSGRDDSLSSQRGPDLRPRRRYLARFSPSADRRRAALADRQLRQAGMAQPSRTGVPGPIRGRLSRLSEAEAPA